MLQAIKNANIRNYSIYLKDIEGKLYLFSYLEYVGDIFDQDMAGVGKDPVTRRWWQANRPLPDPLPGGRRQKDDLGRHPGSFPHGVANESSNGRIKKRDRRFADPAFLFWDEPRMINADKFNHEFTRMNTNQIIRN